MFQKFTILGVIIVIIVLIGITTIIYKTKLSTQEFKHFYKERQYIEMSTDPMIGGKGFYVYTIIIDGNEYYATTTSHGHWTLCPKLSPKILKSE